MAEEQKTYADFEELVFENRNKAYGAYDLRKSYKGILTKAFLIGTLLFSGAIIIPLVYSKAMEGAEEKEEVAIDVNLKDLDVPVLEETPPEEEEIFEEPEEQLQSLEDLAPLDELPPVATIQNIVPEPVKNPPVETPPPPKEDLVGKAISTKTQEGAATTNNAPAPVKGVEGGKGTQEKIEGTKVVDKPVDTKVIHTAVDESAFFGKGGDDDFRRRVQESFDTGAVEGEGILSTTVKFVVETNGSVSQVKATGSNGDFNREAERVIKSIRGWKPAKKGGVNVRSYYSIPLKMRFE